METANPAQRLPPQLLPHVHLVSSYRWPLLHSLNIDTVVEYLHQAPKITREVSAMTWMFLNSPPDGTVILVWQPPQNPRAPNRWAADGYIWGDAEKTFSQQFRGYALEMYSHKIGYSPPHEAVATHARRRYRLVPTGPNPPMIDPSLWLVHYVRADVESHVAANQIHVHPSLQQLMHQRRMLQQHGQLVRKEFMLYDRNNWPVINMPGPMGPPQGQGPPGQRMRHPSGAMMDAGGPSPAKRQRYEAPQSHRPGSSSRSMVPGVPMRDLTLEEEDEDKDLFDLLTPRDISTMRFTKHQEWMEEMLSSPYNSLDLMPVSLGMGRKGELASLTDGFFDAPTEPILRENYTEWAEPLPSGKAAEFKQRAMERIAALNAEMEAMTRLHTKRMAKVKANSVLADAEKRLRAAAAAPVPDKWRLEGGFQALNGGSGVDEDDDETASTTAPAAAFNKGQDLSVDDITKNIETALNQRVRVLKPFECVERGGLLEKAPPTPTPPPPTPPTLEVQGQQNGEEADTEMVDSHEFDLDDGLGGFADVPNLPREGHASDNAMNQQVDSLAAAQQQPQQTQQEQSLNANAMASAPPSAVGSGNALVSDDQQAQQDANEWVMVDKQGAQSPGRASLPAAPTEVGVRNNNTAAATTQQYLPPNLSATGPAPAQISSSNIQQQEPMSSAAPIAAPVPTAADRATEDLHLGADDMIDFGEDKDNDNDNLAAGGDDVGGGGAFEDAIDFGAMDSAEIGDNNTPEAGGGFDRPQASFPSTAGGTTNSAINSGDDIKPAVPDSNGPSELVVPPASGPSSSSEPIASTATGADAGPPPHSVSTHTSEQTPTATQNPQAEAQAHAQAQASAGPTAPAPSSGPAASTQHSSHFSGAHAGAAGTMQSVPAAATMDFGSSGANTSGGGMNSGNVGGVGGDVGLDGVGAMDMDMGMGELDMQMDESAFGDAFDHDHYAEADAGIGGGGGSGNGGSGAEGGVGNFAARPSDGTGGL